jgi:hypothetical protein
LASRALRGHPQLCVVRVRAAAEKLGYALLSDRLGGQHPAPLHGKRIVIARIPVSPQQVALVAQSFCRRAWDRRYDRRRGVWEIING